MSLLKRLDKNTASLSSASLSAVSASRLPAATAEKEKNKYLELKAELHKRAVEELGDELSLENLENLESKEALGPKIEKLVKAALDELPMAIIGQERSQLIAEIRDEVLGFGPITPLLNDPSISEIMVNGPHQVYVERRGKLELTSITFRNNEHVLHIIEKMVSPLGRRIDESNPMVDARLPDGSRINAIIPPLAINGPTLTIRKFSRQPLRIEDLIRLGTLTLEIAQFLEACVKAKLNIVVSGGTGSGKTTTLNVLSSFIPDDERIITIEDAAELQLHQTHLVRLETRPPNIEGKGAVTIRDLVRNALRMRPDRIIVGEVRGGEALDMLQAMNTGHSGSLTTAHANSPRDLLSRLETMVLMAGMELPVRAIREQISSAIDLIIQQNRMRDGSRKITHITEVQGMEGDVIVLQDLYLYDPVKEKFYSTNIQPRFIHKMEAEGVALPPLGGGLLL